MVFGRKSYSRPSRRLVATLALGGLSLVSWSQPLSEVASLPFEPRLQTAPEHVMCVGECEGTLTIMTEPADAIVELPDIEDQYSPGMILREGPVTVAARRIGYESRERIVNVVGDTTETIRLELARTGTLTLILSPADAAVELPQLNRQYEPGMVVPSGAVDVIVNREGYESARRKINIVGNTNARITLSQLVDGTLTLDLFPGDATVELPDIRDKYSRGMTLSAGPVRVRISRRGYETAERTIDVAGATRDLIELERRTSGTLELDLFPLDAEVEILDANVDQDYEHGMTLPVGPIRVAFSRQGYRDQIKTIDIVGDVREIIELEPLPTGTLTLALSPEDALVELPDSDEKYWPGMPLILGPHRVVVRHEGYQEFDQMIDLSGDTTVDVELVPIRKCLPVVSRSSKPSYPREAVSSGTEGFVDVAFEIVRSGRVRNPVVTASSPREIFDEAAIDAIKRYRYILPSADCESVDSVRNALRFTFEITEGSR